MNSHESNLTRALLTEDGRVLIQKPDGSFEVAQGQTDWARLDAMSDEDIDLSDIPEMTDEMFAQAVLRQGCQPIKPKSE